MVTLTQAVHGLLAVSVAELLDLGILQPMGQAPTMVDAAGAVDDVGEVLEAIRRHRAGLPRHKPIPSCCTDTANWSPRNCWRGGRRSEGSLTEQEHAPIASMSGHYASSLG